MPITATCPSCRKQLNVKDEYIGKRLKCPQCSTTFTADATTAAPAGSRGSSAAAPPQRAAAATRGAGGGGAFPRIHLSPGIIALIVAFVAIPTIFFIWSVGPGKVRGDWAKLQPIAHDDVSDVVARGIQAYVDQYKLPGDERPTHMPRTHELAFIISPMPFTMPEKIGFAGTSSEGVFSGNYFPRTGEIEAEVEVGGVTLPSGINIRRGEQKINVTGRNKNGVVTVEVDGKSPEQMRAGRAAELKDLVDDDDEADDGSTPTTKPRS
jgi:hypothetical protein